jgi:hypothetical protein
MSRPGCRTKFSLFGIAILAFTGCTLRPDLIDASVLRSGESEIVDVTVRAADARLIKRRELYFSIVVFECKNHDKRLPLEPYVSGQPVSRFGFPIEGESVTIRGSIPRDALSDCQTPCVLLQGGGYVFGKLESEAVPLRRRVSGG